MFLRPTCCFYKNWPWYNTSSKMGSGFVTSWAGSLFFPHSTAVHIAGVIGVTRGNSSLYSSFKSQSPWASVFRVKVPIFYACNSCAAILWIIAGCSSHLSPDDQNYLIFFPLGVTSTNSAFFKTCDTSGNVELNWTRSSASPLVPGAKLLL